MVHIFLDLEMNMVAEKNTELRAVLPHEIIEIGAVKLDETCRVVGRFCSYVRPRYSQTVHWSVAKLTGISTKQLRKAPYLEEVLPQFAGWMGEDAQLYAWSDNDRTQLEKEFTYKQLWTPALRTACSGMTDFQRVFSRLIGYRNGLSLGKAIAYMGLDFDGDCHDALSDAENCARLLALVMDEQEFARRRKMVPPEPVPPRRPVKPKAPSAEQQSAPDTAALDAAPAADTPAADQPACADGLPGGRKPARRRRRRGGHGRAAAKQKKTAAETADMPTA